jgi:hypothetical protein
MPSTRIELSASLAQTPASPYADGATSTMTAVSKTIPDGNGDDQMKVIRCVDTTVSASGTYTLDLYTGVDAYGVACSAVDCHWLSIENLETGNGGVVEVRPGASNGWTNFLGASSAVKLVKGAALMVYVPKADRLVIASGNKTLDIVETGGAQSAALKIRFGGRQ